jgi:hypothetical protein
MTPIWSADGKQGSISLTKQPVRVAARGGDEEGYLIFAHERLIAVLVYLSQLHEEMAGRWYLEVGLGRLEGPRKPTFKDLEEAEAWITARLTERGQERNT